MEFQFGTNWSDFSRYSGSVIGQTLAMEGMFAFFMESAFIGLLIWGEKRLGPRNHFLAARWPWRWGAGSPLISSWRRTPSCNTRSVILVGAPDGTLAIASFGAFLGNPWALIQFIHNQTAAVVTGSFVIAAEWEPSTPCCGLYPEQSRLYLRAGALGRIDRVPSRSFFPPATSRRRWSARHQPVTLGCNGRQDSWADPMAGVAVIGQPNVAARRLDNPIEMPGALSFLAYGHFGSYVHGLDEFPTESMA